MILRLAVLGTNQIRGGSAIQALASVPVSFDTAPKEEVADSAGDRWSEIRSPLSAEGLAQLHSAQGWVIVLPQDTNEWHALRPGLIEDFRKLRAIRGGEAMTGGLPVFLLSCPTEGTETREELRRFCKDLTGFFETGFGGFSIHAETLAGNGNEFEQCLNQVRETIKAAARDYRWRCFWSSVRGFVAAFILATLLLVILCVAALLALETGAGWRTEYRRLEYGLNPERPILFQVESLTPLEDRLGDIREFLGKHPELPQDSRRNLVDSVKLLEEFVRPLQDAEQWPELVDLKDIAALESVSQSLERWKPPEGKVDRMPLVERANMRKRDILEASRNALAALPALEIQLSMADALLNPSLGSPEAWSKWSQDCLDFQNQPLPLPQKDPLWQLEDLRQARHSLIARKSWVKSARELALGMGLLGPEVGTQGLFLPEPGLEQSLEKVSSLLAEALDSVGEDPGFILSRLGLGLVERIKQRSELCRQSWVKVGQNGLGKMMNGTAYSRQALMDWLDLVQSKPEWNAYGKWTAWLARCASPSTSESDGNQYANPLLELAGFFACESFSLHPATIQVYLPKGNDVDSIGYFMEWDSGFDLSERYALLESDLVENVGDRKVVLFKIGAAKPFVWKWGKGLELVLKEKSTEKVIGKWKANSPLEAGKLWGDGQTRLEWQPKNQGPTVPELLRR